MTERVEKGTKHRETLTKTEFKINSCGKYTTRTQVISNFQRKRTNNASITNSKTVLKIRDHDKKPRCSTSNSNSIEASVLTITYIKCLVL